MISSEQLDVLPAYVIKLWEELEAKMLKDIADKMKVKDVEQLLKLGGDKNQITKLLQTTYKKTEKEVEELMSKATKYSWVHDKEVAEKLKKSIPPLDMQLINAQMKQMKEQFKNITNTTGFFVNNKYTPMAEVLQKASGNAYMEVVSGASDLNEAIKNQMLKIADKGLVWVDYANGSRRRVESTIRMSIITGVNQTVTQITDTNAEALGAEKFEVSAHIGARNTGEGYENHERWQGKIYTKKQLKTVCGLGQITGLGGINCRHTYHPFFEKVSKPMYSKERLANMRGNKFEFNGKVFDGTYEATQMQRKMEAEIRRLKRFRNAGIDVSDKLNDKMRTYKAFCNRANLPTEYERLKVWDIKKQPETLKTWKERVNEIKVEKLEDVQKAGRVVLEEVEKTYNNTYAEMLEQQRELEKELVAKSNEAMKNFYKYTMQADEMLAGDEKNKLFKLAEENSQKYIQIQSELEKIYDKNRDLYDKKQQYNLEFMRNKVAEHRELATKDIFEKQLKQSSSSIKSVLLDASEYYPKEWFEKTAERNITQPVSIRKANRGHFNNYYNEIHISGNVMEKQLECSIHELGHMFEYNIPRIKELEKQFYEKRTANENLKWLGPPYGKNEKSRVDNFLDPYMGKDYGGRAYELVSMGFQYAFTRPDLLLKDRDFAEFILGVLFKI